jgi:hypothetical protein
MRRWHILFSPFAILLESASAAAMSCKDLLSMKLAHSETVIAEVVPRATLRRRRNRQYSRTIGIAVHAWAEGSISNLNVLVS